MDFYAFDDDYVRRLRERDGTTLGHFVSYFTGLLGRKLRGRVPPDAIDDVRQEVFLRVLAAVQRGELREGSRLGAYVNTVCNHVVYERFRKEARTERLDDRFDIASDVDTERATRERETRETVREVLARLSRRDADILSEIFFRETDKDEICRRLKVDRQYLRVLLHRAKEHFRELFRD